MNGVVNTVTISKTLKPGKKLARQLVNQTVKFITNLICKIDARQLARVPVKGPLIIIANHINFLELPIIYPRVPSDLGVGFSKQENWNSPFYRLLFGVWNVIPINRDEVDLTAMRRGLEALEQGMILFITPEGTRSHHGRLQHGKPGVVMMAQRSGAPVLPIGCYGGEKFQENIKHLRRTDFHVVVGSPFYVKTNGVKVTRQVRQQITDEMMYQLAALLPMEYRGVYANFDAATETYLRFASPEDSNLHKAICSYLPPAKS